MNWKESIEIDAGIDRVRMVLNDERYQHDIMPQVVESHLIEEKSSDTVKVFKETYQEGKRSETYEMTLVTEENTDSLKKQSFNFTIANMIESTGSFVLEKLDESRTRFTYSGLNQGVNFMGKFMMKVLSRKSSNDKMVTEFLSRVKEVSERRE